MLALRLWVNEIRHWTGSNRVAKGGDWTARGDAHHQQFTQLWGTGQPTRGHPRTEDSPARLLASLLSSVKCFVSFSHHPQIKGNDFSFKDSPGLTAFPPSLSFWPRYLFRSMAAHSHSQFKGHRTQRERVNQTTMEGVWLNQGFCKCGPRTTRTRVPCISYQGGDFSSPTQTYLFRMSGSGIQNLHSLPTNTH